MHNPRRTFLKSLPALSALPLVYAGHPLLAQSARPVVRSSFPVKTQDTSAGDPDPNIYDYHNANIAESVLAILNGQATPDLLNQLAFNFIDNWNYTVSFGLDQSLNDALSNAVNGLDSAFANDLTEQFQSYGFQVTRDQVAAALSLDGSQTADTVAYIETVGLSGLMSDVYHAFIDQAGAAASSRLRSHGLDCYPYARLGNGLRYGVVLAGIAAYYSPLPQMKGIFTLIGFGLALTSAGLSNFNSC